MTEVALTEEDVQAVLEAYRSGWLTMGPRSQRFEAAFASLVGADFAVAVSSGTSALHLALLGLGVGAGDRVVVPALASAGVAGAVRACGASPVVADCVSPADLAADVAALVEGARVVVLSHLFGYGLALPAVGSDVAVVEDARGALTARLPDGSLAGVSGAAGCFSLDAGRQLPVGEGGVVVSASEAVAAKARSLRSHAMTSVTWDRHRGHAESYDLLDIGFNYRMDEPRAALGLTRLPQVEGEVARRREQARALRDALDGAAELPFADDDAIERGAHDAFPLLLGSEERRDAALAAVRAAGLPAAVRSPLSADAPVAADVARRLLVLPLGEPQDPARAAAAIRTA